MTRDEEELSKSCANQFPETKHFLCVSVMGKWISRNLPFLVVLSTMLDIARQPTSLIGLDRCLGAGQMLVRPPLNCFTPFIRLVLGPTAHGIPAHAGIKCNYSFLASHG